MKKGFYLLQENLLDEGEGEIEMERLINVVELSARLGGLGVGSFKKHITRERYVAALEGLPPPMVVRPKYLWLESDIDKWLSSRSTLNRDAIKEAAAPIASRRGRPTKRETENARKLGLTVRELRSKKIRLEPSEKNHEQ